MARFFYVMMPLMPQILLFTDFGWRGPYLGQVQAFLAAAAPGVPTISLQSDAPAWDPHKGAYLLSALIDYQVAGAIWLCVVDPGVGSDRRPLICRCGEHWFVGPDNGLMAPALKRFMAMGADCSIRVIEWRPAQLSHSFHGRDLFAPVAAWLARGEEVESRTIEPSSLVGWDWPADLWQVIYTDAFGNVMTGVRAGRLGDLDMLAVGGHRLSYARTFDEVPPGRAFWYENALGLVEIAVNQGRADDLPGIIPGAAVRRVRRGAASESH